MIRDTKAAIDATVEWIHLRKRISGADALVLGVSGGVDSAVVAGLCALTSVKTVGVVMPCHSSPDSIVRADEVISVFGLYKHFVNLDAAYESISRQALGNHEAELLAGKNPNGVFGALRSCLRAPTLDFVGKAYNGLIVGTGNRDEDEVTRYFQKRGDGCVDISPIAKYHKSEVYQLAVALGVPASVIKAVPSADLWGPNSGQADEKELGMTYDEVEWGIQFAQRTSKIPLTATGGVSSMQFHDAVNMAGILGVSLSDRQRQILFDLSNLERKSRHKANPNLPVFDARVILNLDAEFVAA